MNDYDALPWKKSSYSGGGQGQQCVEVAELPDGGRAVRDGKNPTGSVLQFTAGEWSAFVKGVRAGELA